MANLTVVAADVAPVRVIEQFTGPCAEAITAGQVVRIDTSTGMFTFANASTAAEGRALGVAIESGIAGQTITVVAQGLVDLGDALTDQTYDETLRLSNTDGALDDGAGTPTGTYNIGRVFPAWGAVTADKILLVEL